MKVVINNCYGGFCFPSGYAAERPFAEPDDKNERINPMLVKYVEDHPDKSKNEYSELIVVEIPDSATDFIIKDYDGLETVYYVIYGKIRTCPC